VNAGRWETAKRPITVF